MAAHPLRSRRRRGVQHAAAALALLATATAQDPVARWYDTQADELLALYRHLHAHPELSFHEQATAERLATGLRAAGIDVTTGVGGTGIVGVLRNGDGPVGMLRTDMDALPVAEATGLPFAAPPDGQGADGRPVGRMHACGHDVHMTCWLGVARWFAGHRDAWHGTLLFVGQPAEERGSGAKAMLAAGLFTRFPQPAWAIALHTAADLPTGQFGLRAGPVMANVDSCDITVFGRGGHGAAPHLTIDPIVIAAHLVIDLQTIVAREIDPVQPAVVTVGAIHGGSKHNIIDDRCSLQLTLRSYAPAVREQLKEAVVRHAKAAAAAARAPEPKVEFSEPALALHNDAALTARVGALLRQACGDGALVEVPPAMVAEDFAEYGAAGVPVCMFRLGTIAPERLRDLQQKGELPVLHSARYRPDAEPALRAGVPATIAVLRGLLAAQ